MSVTAMTADDARRAVELSLAELRKPASQEKLKAILAECAGIADPMMQFQLKMTKLLPAVTEVLGGAFEGRNVMAAVMEVQSFASKDPQVAVGVGKILKALGGDLSGLEAEEEFEDVE